MGGKRIDHVFDRWVVRMSSHKGGRTLQGGAVVG